MRRPLRRSVVPGARQSFFWSGRRRLRWGSPSSDPAIGPQPRRRTESGGESIRGTLIDRKGTRERDDDEPIEGAEITDRDARRRRGRRRDDRRGGQVRARVAGPGHLRRHPRRRHAARRRRGGRGRRAARVRDPAQPEPSAALRPRAPGSGRPQSKFGQIPQLAFEGIKLGLLIAIAAVGLSLAFGTTGLVNFAHGELVTWGAIVAWFINVEYGDPACCPPPALAMVICGSHGRHLRPGPVATAAPPRGQPAGDDDRLDRPRTRRSQRLPADLRRDDRAVQRLRHPARDRLSARSRRRPKDLWTIVIARRRARAGRASCCSTPAIGKATRAVSDNPDLAASSGIDVDRVILFVWVVRRCAGRAGRDPLRGERAGAVRHGLQAAAADVRRHHPRRSGHRLRRSGRLVRRGHGHPALDAGHLRPSSRTSAPWPSSSSCCSCGRQASSDGPRRIG